MTVACHLFRHLPHPSWPPPAPPPSAPMSTMRNRTPLGSSQAASVELRLCLPSSVSSPFCCGVSTQRCLARRASSYPEPSITFARHGARVARSMRVCQQQKQSCNEAPQWITVRSSTGLSQSMVEKALKSCPQSPRARRRHWFASLASSRREQTLVVQATQVETP